MRRESLWRLPRLFIAPDIDPGRPGTVHPGRWVTATWETAYIAPGHMQARQRLDGDVDIRVLIGGILGPRSLRAWGSADVVPMSYWRGEGIILHRQHCAVCATFVTYGRFPLRRFVCSEACLQQHESQCALEGTVSAIAVTRI